MEIIIIGPVVVAVENIKTLEMLVLVVLVVAAAEVSVTLVVDLQAVEVELQLILGLQEHQDLQVVQQLVELGERILVAVVVDQGTQVDHMLMELEVAQADLV